ncbi:hypothetical protein K438DRAFT_1774143 [Mycena galopus ATCC 62051]|nr:hypothetical protein K438DRAFT_1774143 [Mycena galopus ATCC 62051]
MPRGRPPLDPQTKLERRKQTIQRYQEKNKDNLREAARLRMRSHRATIANLDFSANWEHRQRVADNSEHYRQRKRDEERKQMLPQNAEKKWARVLEQEALRASHTQGLKTSQKLFTPAAASKKPRKASGLAPSSTRSSSPWRPKPNKHHESTALTSDHEDEEEPRRFIYTEEPIFARRMPPARKACAGCHMEDCIGCACMCDESTAWIDHPDGEGHFFPACEKWGSADCPGKGSEYLRGSETHTFYVVSVGRIPGIYTDCNCAHKKYVGWTAAKSTWDVARLPAAAALPTHAPSTPRPTPEITRKVAAGPSRNRAKKPVAVSAPSTPTDSSQRLLRSGRQQASTAARRGLADGSFGKMEVTPSVTDAFEHAEESALQVLDISDFSDSE